MPSETPGVIDAGELTRDLVRRPSGTPARAGATAHADCLDQQKSGRMKESTMTGEGRLKETAAADNAIPDRVEVYIGDPGVLPRIRKAFAVSSDGGSFWTIIEPEKLVAH